VVGRVLVRAGDADLGRDGCEALGEDDELLAREVVVLDGFADDSLGLAVRVRIRRVDCVYACRQSDLRQALGRKVSVPASKQALIRGSALSSSNTQGCHLDEPIDIAPKMTCSSLVACQ
jgi:hypothetical protein